MIFRKDIVLGAKRKGGLILFDKVSILPTGNEICSGIVIDTDSVAIREIVLDNFPDCYVYRLEPVSDNEDEIREALENRIKLKDDLVILIGGSGGGHRFVSTLGKDYTHSTLTGFLPQYSWREIYGMNGHLWSKLVVGKKEKTIVFNVPGPHVEAIAATNACMDCIKKQCFDLETIVSEVAKAVLSQYPLGGEIINQ